MSVGGVGCVVVVMVMLLVVMICAVLMVHWL